jgi:LysM repeat protein
MMRKHTVLAVLLLMCWAAFGQELDERLQYVERYKALAIWEMGRRGIPASIKLGQAILESRWGTTDLAVIANNHFGIKCGGKDAWDGPQYYKFDDEYDQKGQMQKSCFRQYNLPEESFIAHSEFLRNPIKEERYGFLFRLDPTDYKGWARGLRKAGYATDPNYHTKLIRIIEELQLWQFDRMTFVQVAAAKNNNAGEVQNLNARFEALVGELIPAYYSGPVQMLSPRREVLPLAPIAVQVLSDLRHLFFTDRQRQSLSVSALLWTYREERDHPAQVSRSYGRRNPYAGKSRYQGKPMWHKVRPNELMVDISREYSIALQSLYARNLLEVGSEVAAGQIVKLRGGKVEKAPMVISDIFSSSPVPQVHSGQAFFRPDPLLRPSGEKQSASGALARPVLPATGGVEPLPLPASSKPAGKPSPPLTVPYPSSYHVVQKGDTLYGISRKYGVPIEMLKSLNSLHGDSVITGTVLRLPQNTQ